MNHLHKIILVNSGNVDFQEMNLDGNIHFIGTQGTGKSTLLRAILFFYNASSTKLGISKEKKSFSEFYFPNADSYIFYEVVKGDRSFCVWLYKKMNRLCFRFIDGKYSRDLVLDKNRALCESDLIKQINEKGYKLSAAIYNFTEYRDIIFGANKSMKQFCLLENKKYNNIPRTLTNIFLNSSLDGGFIKNTIINSLNDDAFIIDLNTNRHHLETARSGYTDVTRYLTEESKAHFIVNKYRSIIDQEKIKQQLAYSIASSYNYYEQQKPICKESLRLTRGNIDKQEVLISKINNEFENTNRLFRDKLSVVKSDISKTNKLIKKYEEENISDVLKQDSLEEQYALLLKQTKLQYDLLTSESADIERNYQLSVKETVAEVKDSISVFEKKNNIEKDLLLKKKNTLTYDFFKKKEDISLTENNNINDFLKQQHNAEIHKINIDNELLNIKNKQYFSVEIDRLSRDNVRLENQHLVVKNDLNIAKLKKESILKESENEVRYLTERHNASITDLNLKKNNISEDIRSLEKDLESFAGSFIEFLDENKSNWTTNIAKLIGKDILLRDDLQPVLSEGNNFYGLELNLDNIVPVDLSTGKLKTELEQLIANKNALTNKIDLLNADYDNKCALFNRKYSKSISEKKTVIKQAEIEISQLIVSIEKNILKINSLSSKESLERKKELETKHKEKYECEKEIKELQDKISDEKQKNVKLLNILIKNKDFSLQEIDESLDNIKNNFSLFVDKLNSENKDILKKLKIDRDKTLNSRGVDVDRISCLEKEKNILEENIKLINDNKSYIIIYKKDCDDYIDKLPSFKLNRKSLSDDLMHKKTLFETRKIKEEKNLFSLKNTYDLNDKILRKIESEIISYHNFEKETLFDELKIFFNTEDIKEDFNCKESIDKLKNIALAYEKEFKIFVDKITEFSSFFSLRNYLGFDVELKNDLEYRIFAENLKIFIDENKILDLKRELSRKYVMVLNNIAAETKALLAREMEVYKLISKINSDFRNSNFVGVVKSIELRALASSEKIIQILRKVCVYQEKNDMEFGEVNLFNQSGSVDKDSEAITLLDEFLNQIVKSDFKNLSLEQVFDLEFRIKENENDTNWVKRIANVGSNGTDVLVKSMIYINLLNIFKNHGSKNNSELMLHCIIDEVGILHDSNITGLIGFASKRNICLINGSPNSHNEQDYKHIYMFRKNPNTSQTGIVKLISHEI